MRASFIQKALLKCWGCAGSLLGVGEVPSLSDVGQLKVALVKNTYFFDLYQTSGEVEARDLIASSLKRSGPVGLFTEFNADFYLVDPYPDFDGQRYRERLHQISDSDFDDYMQLAQGLKRVSVNSADVDWSQYDLVIALDNAVPSDVVKAHHNVIWATMLENHKMPSFKKYLKQPPDGYDVFLTQHFGPNLRQFSYGAHVVDWPYGFTKSGAVARLLGRCDTRSGVTLESHGGHLNDLMSSHLELPIRVQGGDKAKNSIMEILEMMLQSRYFCAVSPRRPLWGNALVEAASAGCLVVGDPNWHWNPYVILPELRVSSVMQAVGKIQELEQSSDYRDALLVKQNERLDWYVYHRPLRQLARVVNSLGRDTNLKSKIP